MHPHLTRRQFLESSLGASAMLGGGLAFLSNLQPVSAEDARLPSSMLRPDDGIEPTLKLIEQTPRETLLEEVASRIKKGLTYREVLAGLLLAGVRNVQPRPQVGFKFHAVLVINSAHLASLASPDGDRWLPIFWALDRFKSAQAETLKANGWKMGAVDEATVPSPSKARQAFIDAMEKWDEQAADAAAAGVARGCGRDEAFELFARFGCRDFRDIGHKAIYVANSFRTLESIGWRHAEPVLRSLAYALLKYDGENPSKSDQDADRPGRRNAELIKKVKPTWRDGQPSAEATTHFLSTFRSASYADACDAVVEALNSGVAPSSIADALLAMSSELLMRQPGILTLHSVTSSNALHYAYQAAGDADLRLMLLLQNASFMTLFRGSMNNRAQQTRVDEFEATMPSGHDAVGEIFAEAGSDRMKAASKALGYLNQTGDAKDLMHTARRLVFLKGNDAHDYKFSSAVLEDYYSIAPGLRNRYLAAAMFYLPSSQAKDNALVGRIRAAFA
jgi:hypothetical protein